MLSSLQTLSHAVFTTIIWSRHWDYSNWRGEEIEPHRLWATLLSLQSYYEGLTSELLLPITEALAHHLILLLDLTANVNNLITMYWVYTTIRHWVKHISHIFLFKPHKVGLMRFMGLGNETYLLLNLFHGIKIWAPESLRLELWEEIFNMNLSDPCDLRSAFLTLSSLPADLSSC